MAMGSSGVAPSSPGIDEGRRTLDLIRNAELYDKRMADLDAATKAANKAKREAGRAIEVAEAEAKEKAEAIVREAESQAQDRLDAVQDLETKLVEDRKVWEEEKSAEQTKLRSDRSKAGAATKAANDAKEKADQSNKAKELATQSANEARQAIISAMEATREIWKKAGI